MSNQEIASMAENWEITHGQIAYSAMDCSHFVVAVLQAAVDKSFPYMVANDFRHSHYFYKVDAPERGDIIHWQHSPHGHVGVVLDPVSQEFIGSQSSTGVAKAKYGSGYWAKHGSITFLRYQG
ncbi:MAG: C40 family peptidase [Polyangiaceae bacterium]|nr:C40 family peptidase [Polyangiaceae bacterium]